MTRTVTHTVTASAPPSASNDCTASDLTGTFAELPGSAGAGNIVYTLKLTNAAPAACTLPRDLPLGLRDAQGNPLPSDAKEEGPQLPLLVVQPGASATAQARFSPDVNGVGENGSPCEPKAYKLHVTLPDGTALDVNIDPPTSVCSHGAMQVTRLTTAD